VAQAALSTPLTAVLASAIIVIVNPPALSSDRAGFYFWYNQSMNESERIFIIIDGNNFYHRLKELNF